MLEGYGHYEGYIEPAFSAVMQATLDCYRQYLPARGTRDRGRATEWSG